MKKFLLVVLSATLFLTTRSQVIINNLADPYIQDFNSLANVGTSNVLPTGWALLETGGNANDSYLADNGTANSGNTYSYGPANNIDRAFGAILSGSVTPTIGVQFTNNSGATITSITVTYTGEQWRLGTANREDRLDFQYSTDATALNNGNYNHVDALDFVAPVTVIPLGALDGNAPANKKNIPAFEIVGLNIPDGTSFWFRWTDFNASGADDGLGIDDITVTFNGNANPPCVEPLAQPTDLMLNPTPTTVSGSFTAAIPPADEYLVVRSLVTPLGASPIDATNYVPGEALGNGTVVNVSSTTDFNAVGLVPNTQYFFFVFALNNESCSGAPNYNNLNPLELGVNTLPLPACVSPANSPTNLILNPGNNFVSGSFTASANANRYLVVRSTNNILGFTPTNGDTYTPGQVIGADVIVSYGSSTNFNAGGLAANTQYFFFVFAANGDCNGEPFYNTSSLDGNTTTQNGQGIPANYYTPADGLNCQNLKTTLKNILNTNTDTLSYTPGVWAAYQFTDLRKDDNNVNDIVWDMYSDNPNGPEPYTYTYIIEQCGNYQNEGDCYNREHSMPQSWFKEFLPMKTDLHHVFPTDGKVNGLRSNYPYGEVQNIINVPGFVNPSANGSRLGTGDNFGYNGTVFEPIDTYKGDFARAQFYMAIRYEDHIITDNWSANGNANEVLLSIADEPDAAKRRLEIYDDWYIKLLFKWHIQDPVSQKEIDRNNAIYYQEVNDGGNLKIQGNRNPFVDHPEYVMAIWNCGGVLPVTITSFTVTKNNNAALLRWSATYETKFKRYEIEQSTDGVTFNKVGEVQGNNFSNYSFTINNLPKSKLVYYRLKMIDIDNQFDYSKVVSLKLTTSSVTAIVYPNPATDKVTVKLEQALSLNSEIKILDLSGRIVLQQKINAGQQNINLAVDKLSSGRYFIKISNGNETINHSFNIVK